MTHISAEEIKKLATSNGQTAETEKWINGGNVALATFCNIHYYVVNNKNNIQFEMNLNEDIWS